MILDVAIVGGGPSGLAAALVLGRARMRTVVIDDDDAPRNAASAAVHGFLGHDGTAPAELRRSAWAELARYPDVSRRATRAVGLARGAAGRVQVELADGTTLEARRVLLACGVVDQLPKIPGLRERWGRDAFSCPFCHGWEARDRTWGVLAVPKTMVGTLRLARIWARDVLVLLDGRSDVDVSEIAREAELEREGRPAIRIEPRPIVALHGEEGRLERVEVGGEGAAELVPCGALWLHPTQRPVDLVLYAGIAVEPGGLVRVGPDHETSMRGVHACGDLTAHAIPQALQAAADGARAAIELVHLLADPDPRR